MKNKIKIFIDTPFFAIGGVESFSINLALSMQNTDNYEVYLLESKNNQPKENKLSDKSLESIAKQVSIVSLTEYYNLIKEKDSRSIVITSWNRDVIDNLSKMYESNQITKQHTKVIGYVHSEASQYYDTMNLYEAMFDMIVCVSKPAQLFLQEKLPSFSGKILFRPCPTAINLDSFEEKLFSKPKERINLCFVGRIEDKIKGVFRIPQILRILKDNNVDFFIKIIGNGTDKAELENKLKEFKGNYSINFASGQVELAKMLEDVDVILLTSNYEGGPLVIYEAMAVGLVPIVHPVGNMPNLIKHKKNGFILPINDIEGFAKVIQDLYEDKGMLTKIGKEGYNTVKSLGYFQKEYTEFFKEEIKDIWKVPFVSAKEIKSSIAEKKARKFSDTENWVKETIPAEIIIRYWIKEYLAIAGGPNDFSLEEFEKNKNAEITNHYNLVYEEMPTWWKKIGSLIRKSKK